MSRPNSGSNTRRRASVTSSTVSTVSVYPVPDFSLALACNSEGRSGRWKEALPQARTSLWHWRPIRKEEAAATGMTGAAQITPPPALTPRTLTPTYGQPAPLLRSRRGTRAAGAVTHTTHLAEESLATFFGSYALPSKQIGRASCRE